MELEFLCACKDGDLTKVKSLVENGIIPNDFQVVDRINKTDINRSGLMNASLFGHFDIVKYLVENKISNINTVNKYGKNALMFACFCRQNFEDRLKIIKYLIVNGTNINKLVERTGKTAFIYMMDEYITLKEIECNEIFDLMIKYGFNNFNSFIKSRFDDYYIDSNTNALMYLSHDVYAVVYSKYIYEKIVQSSNLAHLDHHKHNIFKIIISEICNFEGNAERLEFFSLNFKCENVLNILFEYLKIICKYNHNYNDIITSIMYYKKRIEIQKIDIQHQEIKHYLEILLLYAKIKIKTSIHFLQIATRDFIHKP